MDTIYKKHSNKNTIPKTSSMTKWAMFKKFIRPELYPLCFTVSAILGLSGFLISRNLTINPDVRINKDDRVAGILKNHKEGKTYYNHQLRGYLRSHYPSYFDQYENSK